MVSYCIATIRAEVGECDKLDGDDGVSEVGSKRRVGLFGGSRRRGWSRRG